MQRVANILCPLFSTSYRYILFLKLAREKASILKVIQDMQKVEMYSVAP